MQQQIDLKLKVLPKLTPQLITAQYLLQLNSVELLSEIERELEENPALEIEENPTCPRCGEEKDEGICPKCEYKIGEKILEEDYRELEQDEQEYLEKFYEEEKESLISKVPTLFTLRDYLKFNLQVCIKSPLSKKIGTLLIENIDEDGYLKCNLKEIALELETNEEEVEKVLKIIQTLDPVGVGARDLKECLVIQINYLEGQKICDPYAKKIIEKYLDEMGKKKFGKIASRLNISVEDVKKSLEFIQKNLNPYPGREYHTYGIESSSSDIFPKVDVIIQKQEQQIVVDLLESKQFNLKVSPFYLKLYRDYKENKHNSQELSHIKNYLNRAKLFIKNINSRRETLLRIAKSIVEEQREFLEKEDRKYLKSVTQEKIAKLLNLNKSTVCRAINNKFALLPWREITAFSLFFDSSQSIKKIILELIEKENTNKPFSDEEICKILKTEGINIARRTLTKYREELKILPSHLRKKV